MKPGFLLLAIFLKLAHSAFAQKLASVLPVALTCNYREAPLGIDDPAPRFGWQLESGTRNQWQSAYEIVLADTMENLSSGKMLWESGKIASGEMIQVPYSGAALKPYTRYWWQVRVWDGAGNASEWSTQTFFETAALKPEDWKGKWIGDGRKQFEKDEDFYGDDPMPVMRRNFRTAKKLATARLYISGLGYYEAYINGKKVGNSVLDPGWTNYEKQILYSTYDVTSLVQNGNNNIGVMLGNGWYNPLPLRLFGRFNLRDAQQTGRPCLNAQMLLRYSDGSEEWIITDDSWQTALGPIIRNNVYLGEHYDAQKEIVGFGTMGEKKNVWKNATLVNGPSGMLSAQMQPPVVAAKVLQPTRIYERGKDTFIVDFGRNMAGVARIRVKGPAGTTVSLRYGEDVHPNGSLNYMTSTAGQIKEAWKMNGGPGAPKTAWQQDSYTLKGSGTETWAPRFTFHGFRYVEITGWPGTPSKRDIDALVLHTDLKPTGTFASANDSLNRLWQVVQNTFLSNVFSVQSDCPGREKMGYGADIVVTAESFLYQYNMAQFYHKAVQDFANDQQPDGGITETAPFTGIADRGYGGNSGPLGWELAFPFLQKKLYEFYGDRNLIAQQYPAVQKQMGFLQQKAVNGLFHWDISDHEALDTKPEAFSAAAFYYQHAKLAADFAGILNKKQDSLHYDSLAKAIRSAIIAKYEVPGTGRFDNATQSAQLFALWYCFAGDTAKTLAVLQQELARHKDHLATGIFSTKYFLDVMRSSENGDLAYNTVTQQGYPGWMYMLQEGATTLWETWKKSDNVYSQNHPMFGSVLEWMYRSLLGINALAPGFAQVQIKPQPPANLQWAKGTYHSVRGNIGVSWKKTKKTFQMEVEVPPNTGAEIWIPAEEGATITESGKPVVQDVSLNLLRRQKGYVVVQAGSGKYNFEVQ